MTGTEHRPRQRPPAPARVAEKIFPTPAEALAAIRIDFAQYAPQAGLFCSLVPLVFGDHALVVPGTRRDEVWLRTGAGGPLERLDYRRLGERLVARLQLSPPALAPLAAICCRVFRGRTRAGEKAGRPGLWVETGMADFVCGRCGRCCSALDFRNAGTAEDWGRFAELNRRDILAWIAPVRPNGGSWVANGAEGGYRVSGRERFGRRNDDRADRKGGGFQAPCRLTESAA